MVTAEIAVALPVVVVLLGAALTAVAVVAGQLRCVDAAREAARAAARGEPAAVVRSLAAQAAPNGAAVEVSTGGDEVTVRISARVHTLGGLLPSFGVAGTAVALREPVPP